MTFYTSKNLFSRVWKFSTTPWGQIVETTFRSCFRFRFLKYPLFKKVVSFHFSVIRKYPLLKKVFFLTWYHFMAFNIQFSKFQVIRLPIMKNNTGSGDKKMVEKMLNFGVKFFYWKVGGHVGVTISSQAALAALPIKNFFWNHTKINTDPQPVLFIFFSTISW